jgi:hypothetical protein
VVNGRVCELDASKAVWCVPVMPKAERPSRGTSGLPNMTRMGVPASEARHVVSEKSFSPRRILALLWCGAQG